VKRPPPSLQARAVAWLAQREHSRAELRRKLLRAAQRQADAEPSEAPAETLADEVEQVLDALQARDLLSDQRFADSRLRVRAAGQGTRRIQAELARHGLKLAAQPLQQLRDSELERAAQLWQRRFGRPPADAKERARQMRFLAGRGFAGDVIRKLLGGAPGAADTDPAEAPA
jgi:regulatory protein